MAHTLLEAMYHPTVYKTVLCSNFDERDPQTWKRCQWGRMCAHAHSKAELEFNDLCQRQGEAAAVATYTGQVLPEQLHPSLNPAPITTATSAVIVYDNEEIHSPPSNVSALFYREGKAKDTKPPLPPARSPFAVSHLSLSSPTPLPHSSGSMLSPITSPQAISSLWGKPPLNTTGSTFTTPVSSAPSSNANSPLTSSTRQPNPIQPRTHTPISTELSSYFTPLGPTLLRDDGQGEFISDKDDSIIIPSHPFSSSSSSTTPSPSTFLSPLSSWQSTPSGSLTPASSSGPLFSDFDSSFMDSAITVSSSSSSLSSPSHSTVEVQHLRSLLTEESERSTEANRETSALRSQLAALQEEKRLQADELASLTAQLLSCRSQVADLVRQRCAQCERTAELNSSEPGGQDSMAATTGATASTEGVGAVMSHGVTSPMENTQAA